MDWEMRTGDCGARHPTLHDLGEAVSPKLSGPHRTEMATKAPCLRFLAPPLSMLSPQEAVRWAEAEPRPSPRPRGSGSVLLTRTQASSVGVAAGPGPWLILSYLQEMLSVCFR